MVESKQMKICWKTQQDIRVVLIGEEPWFVGKDVAAVLGYTDTNQAIRNHVDEEDKLTRKIDGSGQKKRNDNCQPIWSI